MLDFTLIYHLPPSVIYSIECVYYFIRSGTVVPGWGRSTWTLHVRRGPLRLSPTLQTHASGARLMGDPELPIGVCLFVSLTAL